MQIKLEWYIQSIHEWRVLQNRKVIEKFTILWKKFELIHMVDWYSEYEWKNDHYRILTKDYKYFVYPDEFKRKEKPVIKDIIWKLRLNLIKAIYRNRVFKVKSEYNSIKRKIFFRIIEPISDKIKAIKHFINYIKTYFVIKSIDREKERKDKLIEEFWKVVYDKFDEIKNIYWSNPEWWFNWNLFDIKNELKYKIKKINLYKELLIKDKKIYKYKKIQYNNKKYESL